jgi:hypothetical protein
MPTTSRPPADDNPTGGHPPQPAPQQPAGETPARPAGLTRVTLNLTPRAKTALDAITTTSGDSHTDTINTALRNTALLIRLADADGAIHVKGPNDTTYVVRLF